MKKVLRSTSGTLLVAAFLAIAPPMYAVAVMADIAVTGVGMLSEDMPPPAMLRVDTVVSVLAVDALILRGPRAATRVLQDAHVIGMAVATGEAVIGEAVTGIRPMDILDWAITAWATAIHTTGLAITVTPTVGNIIRTTDTILTATATGRP